MLWELSNSLPTLRSPVLFIKDARSLELISSRTCTWDCLCFKMAAKKKTKGGIDHEQIIMQFNQMRQEIRSVMGKIGELELEVNEHRWDTITAVKFYSVLDYLTWRLTCCKTSGPIFVCSTGCVLTNHLFASTKDDITVEFFVHREGT